MKQRLMGAWLAGLLALPLAAMAGDAPVYTGTKDGVPAMAFTGSREFPPPQLVEGKPVETRPPEKADNKPAFPNQTRAPYEKTAPYRVVTVASGLSAPWALAFLPNGRMLVTEKPGTMRIVDGDGTISAPSKGVPAVYFAGQVGLLDVVLDRSYARNNRIFFSYSESVGTDGSTIVVASAKLDEAGLALGDVKVIFRTAPVLPKGLGPNAGGRIAVDPKDGNLFVIIGDRSRSPPWEVAQDLSTHLGKMIHITPEGRPAPDNPYLRTKGALPEIWSRGHRSEEGLAFDVRGRLWESEHGARGGDELNLIKRGANYGWPLYAHGIDYPGIQLSSGKTGAPGIEEPVYYWDPVIAPSGLAFYNANLFPQWKGSVLVGGLRGVQVARLKLVNDRVVEEEPLLAELRNRIRDVRVGPEGAVYVLTDNGLLQKLLPK